jgi:hypothetical protein
MTWPISQLDDEYLRELVDRKFKGDDLSPDVRRELEGAEITDELKPTSDRYNYGYSTTASTNELREHGYGN